VIQGSGLGPATYLVTASDLRPVYDENFMVKFADDIVLDRTSYKQWIVYAELAHINYWADRNNLLLNCSMTKEILFRFKGKRPESVDVQHKCITVLVFSVYLVKFVFFCICYH